MKQSSLPPTVYKETVLSVCHYTDHLFSFSITRPRNLRFRSGEFLMIALPPTETNPSVFRAYSVASPAWDNKLEFFSIKVPDGRLTSQLQKIKVGDSIIVRPKATGTLVLDALKSGKRLFMLSTGTGIAPFASLIRDIESYEKFEKIILTQTCRNSADLTYGKDLIQTLPHDELVGEYASERVLSYFSTTREQSTYIGRITDLIQNRRFFSDLAIEPFDPEHDRVMICGSVSMINDTKKILEEMSFEEGSLRAPNNFVIERAFTE